MIFLLIKGKKIECSYLSIHVKKFYKTSFAVQMQWNVTFSSWSEFSTLNCSTLKSGSSLAWNNLASLNFTSVNDVPAFLQ